MSHLQAHDVGPDGVARFSLTQFTPNEVMNFWSGLEDMLDKLPHTWRYWTKEYIFEQIMQGGLQVWGAGPPPNAVFILMTCITTYPAAKVLHVVWGAGKLPDGILSIVDAAFLRYAQQNECSEIEVRGRIGWEPHVKKLGYQRAGMIWTKPVPNARAN